MTENDRDLHDRIDEYMYTSGSLLVMSKLPNFVFRKIQNCTGCQIFILGYHLQYNVEDHQANCMILLSQL